MTTETKKIIRQNELISGIDKRQIAVEPGEDSDLGFRMWGGKDNKGDTYKFLGKDKPAQVKSLTVTDLIAGVVRSDADGAITSGAESTLQQAYAAGNEIEITGAPFQLKLKAGGAPFYQVGSNNEAFALSQEYDGKTHMILFPDDLKLQDEFLTAAIPISETGEAELDTTAQSLVGAINELAGQIGTTASMQSAYDNGALITIESGGNPLAVETAEVLTHQSPNLNNPLYYIQASCEIDGGSTSVSYFSINVEWEGVPS